MFARSFEFLRTPVRFRSVRLRVLFGSVCARLPDKSSCPSDGQRAKIILLRPSRATNEHRNRNGPVGGHCVCGRPLEAPAASLSLSLSALLCSESISESRIHLCVFGEPPPQLRRLESAECELLVKRARIRTAAQLKRATGATSGHETRSPWEHARDAAAAAAANTSARKH